MTSSIITFLPESELCNTVVPQHNSRYYLNLIYAVILSPPQIHVCLTIYIDAKIDPKVSYYDYIIAYFYPFVSLQRREFTISQHFQIANLFISKEIGLYLNLASGIFFV